MNIPISFVQQLLAASGAGPPSGQARNASETGGLFAMLLACMQGIDVQADAGATEGTASDTTPASGQKLPTWLSEWLLSAGEASSASAPCEPDEALQEADEERPASETALLEWLARQGIAWPAAPAAEEPAYTPVALVGDEEVLLEGLGTVATKGAENAVQVAGQLMTPGSPGPFLPDQQDVANQPEANAVAAVAGDVDTPDPGQTASPSTDSSTDEPAPTSTDLPAASHSAAWERLAGTDPEPSGEVTLRARQLARNAEPVVAGPPASKSVATSLDVPARAISEAYGQQAEAEALPGHSDNASAGTDAGTTSEESSGGGSLHRSFVAHVERAVTSEDAAEVAPSSVTTTESRAPLQYAARTPAALDITTAATPAAASKSVEEQPPDATAGPDSARGWAVAPKTVDAAASAPKAAPSPESPSWRDVAEPVIKQVRYMAANGEKRLTVRLEPESLGEVRLEVSSSGSELNVRLASTNEGVREILEARVHDLRHALARQGVEATRVTVSTDLPGGQTSGGALERQAFDFTGYGRSASGNRTTYQAPQGAPDALPARRTHHEGTLNVFV